MGSLISGANNFFSLKQGKKEFYLGISNGIPRIFERRGYNHNQICLVEKYTQVEKKAFILNQSQISQFSSLKASDLWESKKKRVCPSNLSFFSAKKRSPRRPWICKGGRQWHQNYCPTYVKPMYQ